MELRAQVRQARADRKAALEQARARCKAERLAARERVHALRERVLLELRQAVEAERTGARQTCSVRLSAARGIADRIARVRAELQAERTYQRDLRRIERANTQRTRQHHRTTAAEHRSQSDDEVRGSISPELVPLWAKVKRSIRGSDRESRLEAFLRFAEENPAAFLEVLEDRSDDLVRELEARERDASRAFREMPSPPPAFDPPPESYADSVPF